MCSFKKMQHDSLPKTLEEILARDENDVPIMLSPLDKLIGKLD